MSETKKNIIEAVRFVATVFILWLIIRVFFIQPFLVDGASMSPNFETSDYLIVDKLTHYFTNPARGDVVVFKYPSEECRESVEKNRWYAPSPCKNFIKRVIGLPGETVTILDGKTTVQKADGTTVTIDERFLQNTSPEDSKVTILSTNEYFVMGDNRPHSFDSRAWGPLEKKYIAGRALVRLFPFNKVSLFPAGIKSFGVTTIEQPVTQ
jgi:signal peptidase I